MLKQALCLVTATLILTNCAGTQEKSGSLKDAGATGTLTIDGKTEKLEHVYARRIERYRLGGDEAIAVFLANKPLPKAELDTLLNDFAYGAKQMDFLKDSSINGLFFLIKKEEPFHELVGFERFVIKAGRLLEAPVMAGEWFKEFSLMQGRVIARSEGPEFVPDDYKPENGLTYSYTARFESDLQGKSACKEFEGSPSADVGAVISEPGTAVGSVVVNGKKMKLEYAYARRKRVFFDEPDELVEVLITDRPCKVEEIATILEMYPGDTTPQRLVLKFSNNPTVTGHLEIFTPDGYYPDSAEAKDFLIKKDRISGRTKGTGASFKEKWSYSVSLDVPFKSSAATSPTSQSVSDPLEGLFSIEFSFPSGTYSQPQQRRSFVRQVISRIKSLPEAESVAAVGTPPRQPQTVLDEDNMARAVELNYSAVTPGYFLAAKVELIRGRLFQEDDGPNKPRLIILSESAARKLIPDSMEPIGNRISFSQKAERGPWLEVIGVVADEQESRGRPRTEIYGSYDQDPDAAVSLVVRTKSGSQITVEKLTEEILVVDKHVTVSKVESK